MAEPEKQIYEDDEPKSARERANAHWGMSEPEEAVEPETKPGWYHHEHPEGGGESTERKRGHLKSVDSPEELKDQESGGGLYNPEGGDSKETGAAKPKSKRTGITGRISGMKRRNKIAGGGILGAAIGAGIAAFIILTPLLRLESYLAKINQRVFAYTANAVEKRVQNLAERYIAGRVLVLEQCTAVRSNDCKVNYANAGIAKNLFLAWQDARIEQKLFDGMGFKIESTNNPDRKAGVHRFTLRDNKTGKSIVLSNVKDWDNFKDGQFKGGRREFGRVFNNIIKDNTKWYQILQRVSYRRYATRKHGAKFWCFSACKTVDKAELKLLDAKTRFKYRLVERVVYPFSGKYGLIMDCIISGGSKCNTENFKSKKIDRNKLSQKEVEKIIAYFDKNPTAKLKDYFFQKFLVKVIETLPGKLSAQETLDSIPIAGQIYLAVTIVDMLDRMDSKLKDNTLGKFAASINADQYLEFYTAMRSNSDELKSHVLGIDEAGAVMDSFKGAEDSLVYKQNYDPGSVESARGLPDNKCQDGKPIPKGQVVCKEKRVARTFVVTDWRNNDVVDGLATTLNTYGACIGGKIVFGKCPQGEPRKYIRPILGGINKIADSIFGTFAKIAFKTVAFIPGVDGIMSFVQDKFGEIIQFFFGYIFPLPISADDTPKAARDRYDGLEAGGELAAYGFGSGSVSSNDYGIGGQQLSPQQAVAVWQDYNDQQNFDYKRRGLFARLTDLGQPDSLASRAVQSAPSSPSQFAIGFSTVITSIFNGKMFASLAHSLFIHKANADVLPIDAFGIPKSGYSVNDPAINMDPALLTKDFCDSAKQERDASKTVDFETGLDLYSKTDPCQLTQIAAETASAEFTND